MDPEIRRLLEETKALVKDNHRMLRAIRRDYWFGVIGKVIFWIIIIGLPFYFYQQYLLPAVKQYSIMPGVGASGLGSIPTTTAELQKLLDSLKAGQ